ncbi:MAG: hypothetical protein HYZ11_08185 [Candidatus Tectomicrobia bacterium]|uniref:Uncharacterized protein n=1 Tax=Tectimicrobiota bacterium TaxID=2528274 RepID=A0A932I0A3_UNCTE|nr:hypothetical protein [Candidatus Tectomicrobia bacterium]
MANPQFRCPHCNALLTKSEADQVLGEAAGFVVFGPSAVACPSCGGSIDRKGIISGQYDEKRSVLSDLAAVAILIGLAVLFIWWLNG